MTIRIPWWMISWIILFGLACQPQEPKLFHLLPPDRTGVHFTNAISENDSLNVIDYIYLYNGGGVGVGDLNNDGLPDLFFAGNQVSSQLYLNQGGMQFQEVTEQAGVRTDRWATGVSLVDINQDSRLDIYVCIASKFGAEHSRNYFFINQGTDEHGVPSFVDRAEMYGLDDAGYSTQAAFFDYDRDGDLDMYLLTNGMEKFDHDLLRDIKTQGEGISNDRLYRNDSPADSQRVRFTDVTREAGILTEGYGLGVAISDINRDGYPDVFATNDFITNDLLWINNGDGTFTDRADDYFKHQSRNSMGTDIADFNNDGRVDIVVLDMLPEDNFRQKIMMSKPSYDRFHLALNYGYQPQYIRNTLQLNNGVTSDGTPSFSEIGQLAGIHNTDWSWSALFADYDNDGYRDLLITNGYVKDVTDLDYITYQSASAQFGTRETRHAQSIELTKMLKQAKIHNYIYRNNGGDPDGQLTFTDQSEAWGVHTPSFSNGTAFADLDRDGDLDLVMNNINESAFIYENQLPHDQQHHYLRISLRGPPGNPQGFQAEVTLHYDGRQQYHYHSPYRGYKSTVDPTIHFGLGPTAIIDTLHVRWPDGSEQILQNVSADQTVALKYPEANSPPPEAAPAPRLPLLTEVTDSLSIQWRHQETDFVDFNYQSLLPRKYSQEGPGLATGDVNGDGREDVFVGGARFQSGVFLMQQPDGTFIPQPLSQDEECEDTGALLLDVDQDRDLDLYVVSGSNEEPDGHPSYQDRLYLNDGQGQFRRDSTALPPRLGSGSCVTAADYDQDGDLDLFVGGRIKARQYPLPVTSYILENDRGRFRDVTAEVAPALVKIGMVTTALWTDFTNDGRMDLIVAGEWMPITLLENQNGAFRDVTATAGLAHSSGWWNSLASGDFDRDGDLDYLAGNVGLNTKYRASAKEPVSVYAKDFDHNGSIDPILSYFIQGIEYPSHSRSQLIGQLVGMRRRYPTFESYAQTSLPELFTDEERDGVYTARSEWMRSSFLENQGDGRFRLHPLPNEVQLAPVQGILVRDIDQDGNPDALMVGNSYSPETQHGWFDASIGSVLLGTEEGTLRPLSLPESGFHVDTDAKALVEVLSPEGGPTWLVSSNNDSLVAYQRRVPVPETALPLQPEDASALIIHQDGRSEKREFYYGSSYLSQSGRHLLVPPSTRKITITDFAGQQRTVSPQSVASHR